MRDFSMAIREIDLIKYTSKGIQARPQEGDGHRQSKNIHHPYQKGEY